MTDCEGRGGPQIAAFFHEPSFTVSYVVHDPLTRQAAIIDSVLDFDAASGRTACTTADAIVSHVVTQGLTVAWHLETHVHADHLSAALPSAEPLDPRHPFPGEWTA